MPTTQTENSPRVVRTQTDQFFFFIATSRIDKRIRHTMVAISGSRGVEGVWVPVGVDSRDHLRPRGVLSACDLLTVGNDLEGTSIFFFQVILSPMFIQK